MPLIRITVVAPDDILRDFGAAALLHLERASVKAGPYTDTTLTKVVELEKYSYEIWDPTGLDGDWYRTWYTTAAAGSPSNRSEPFSPAAPKAYATLDDLLLVGPRPSDRSTDKIARMEGALVSSREKLDGMMGTDFFRHPTTGDDVWTVDAPGGSLLHLHGGIVSLTSLEVRDSIAGAWTVVGAADVLLEPDMPGEDEPYFHVRLTGAVSRASYPRGSRLLRFTGARGWPKFPRLAVEANIDLARQALASDANFDGGQTGPPELGRPTGAPQMRMPDSVYRLLRAYNERFVGCWL